MWKCIYMHDGCIQCCMIWSSTEGQIPVVTNCWWRTPKDARNVWVSPAQAEIFSPVSNGSEQGSLKAHRMDVVTFPCQPKWGPISLWKLTVSQPEWAPGGAATVSHILGSRPPQIPEMAGRVQCENKIDLDFQWLRAGVFKGTFKEDL